MCLGPELQPPVSEIHVCFSLSEFTNFKLFGKYKVWTFFGPSTQQVRFLHAGLGSGMARRFNLALIPFRGGIQKSRAFPATEADRRLSLEHGLPTASPHGSMRVAGSKVSDTRLAA